MMIIKKIVLNIIIVVVVVLVLDFAIGSTLRYFYFKQDSGFLSRTTFAIENTTADVIIFGASTANHHYYPEVFKEKLKMSYYNSGRDGNSILYHYAVLKSILKRFSPKIVILDLGRGEFNETKVSYDRLSSLLPYYKKHPEIRSIIELKSPFEKIKLISKIYPFNSMLLSIAIGNTEYNKKRWNELNGYIPVSKVWNAPVKTDSALVNYSLDSIKIKIYKRFLEDCINSNVKLFVVCSPCYIKFLKEDSTIVIGQEMAQKKNINFFVYSNYPLFLNNPSYFGDPLHLNNDGAQVFSTIIADEICKYIKP